MSDLRERIAVTITWISVLIILIYLARPAW